jgi:hypothetical protein
MKLLFRQVLDEMGCTLLEETVDTMMAYKKKILHCNLIKKSYIFWYSSRLKGIVG